MMSPLAKQHLNSIAVSEVKLLALLEIYNDLLNINFKRDMREYGYHKTISNNKTLYDMPFYPDLVNLYSIITTLKVKPRDYILYQFKNYRRPTTMSRQVPTLKMLTTPAAIELWEKQFFKPVYAISDKDIEESSKKYMLTLMSIHKLTNEEDFFKDPMLISQVAKSFLHKQPIFRKLLAEGYYLKHFKLTAADLT